jgi:SHS2 domain-containing protein
MQSRGFEEIPHMADWSIRVWAEDIPALLAEAARGMNALAGAQLTAGPREMRTFAYEAPDEESMLVAFLSELVYAQEHENMGFDKFRIRLEDSSLKVDMEGAPLASLTKAIKAVTFHNLKIIRTVRGSEVEIVFDV